MTASMWSSSTALSNPKYRTALTAPKAIRITSRLVTPWPRARWYAITPAPPASVSAIARPYAFNASTGTITYDGDQPGEGQQATTDHLATAPRLLECADRHTSSCRSRRRTAEGDQRRQSRRSPTGNV